MNRLHELRTNCMYVERAFSYCAPRLSNKIPLEIINLPNMEQFKEKLKTYLFEQCYNMEDNTNNEMYSHVMYCRLC